MLFIQVERVCQVFLPLFCNFRANEQVQFLFDAAGFFILVSLVRRARKMYNIPGNQCEVSPPCSWLWVHFMTPTA